MAMRSTLVSRIAKPSLVVRLASPTDLHAAFPSQAPAEKVKSKTRPRGDGRGGVVSEVGLAAASLLPPLPLYRRILRVHRALPIEMKSIGDQYVKDEFRRHRAIDNPLQIVGFLTQWKIYLDGLENQTGTSFKGRQLDMQHFEKLSDDQLYQLHELLTVTKELFDPERAQSQPPGGAKSVNEAVDEALQRAKEVNARGKGDSGD